MTTHFLPIESIPSRYTEQMRRWVVAELIQRRIHMGEDFIVYEPEMKSSNIRSGQFLDNHNSLIFKQQQLALLIESMRDGGVESGDLILVGDVWYPGLEGVRMVAELMGIDITIAGWHYAGVYDPHDYYSKTLGPWSRLFENMLVGSVVDYICCGSGFHKGFVTRNIDIAPAKVLAYGLAWDSTDVRFGREGTRKEKIVVFSHRLAEEKAPAHFIMAASVIKETHPEWRFVFSVTTEPNEQLREMNAAHGNCCEFVRHVDTAGKTAKEHYYDLLARSWIVYSAGYQETFGYSVHEGMALGCSVCLPNRACYPETVMGDTSFIYEVATDSWGVAKLLDLMAQPPHDLSSLTNRFNTSINSFLNHITI